MSFLSGLKVFGKDIEKAFAWFGSDKGQKVVAAGEQLVEDIVPGSKPIIDLANYWAKRVWSVEALAAAAGKAKGTGAEKASMVIGAVVPAVLKYAAEEGLSPRTADQIQRANDHLLGFINAMTEETAAPAA